VLLFPKTTARRQDAPRAPIHAAFPALPTIVPGTSLARNTNLLPRGAARLVGTALVAAALAIGSGLVAAAGPADEPVTLNFVNADIDAVVRAIAEITGRNFVVDPKVKGTINIVSARPVPRSLVYPTLLSALRMQGFTAVEGEGVVKIVPEPDAKQQGGAVVHGPVGAGGDRLVTQVITLRYESAAQLVNVLRPLITPNNTIAAYPGSNALVITDYADNLKRLDKIIASLDQAPAGEPVIVPVRHASALDLVPMLNRLLVDGPVGAAVGDAQQRVVLVADPRSNSIIVRSDNPGRAARVRQLIGELDTPQRAGGNMFIVYLRHAEAVRVAQTLRALLTGSDGQAPGGGSLASGTTGGMQPSIAGAMASTSPASPIPVAATTLGGTSGGTVAFSAGGATIQADSANNALVIMAPEPVYNNLRTVIDKLDVRRAQVYVEALIVEVAADKAAEFGIQWQALGGIGKDNWQGVGGTNFGVRGGGSNIIDASQNLASVGQGLNLGVINGNVTIPGVGTVLNLAFLARALETQAGANILSTPTLLTLDNEEARIMVGQNVPFVTGQYATTGGSNTVTPFQTIERRDVGLMLRVKPQITEGGSVRLVIYQEVSRVESATTAAGIVLQKRAVESSVVIDDQQIIVLGGLIQDSFADGTEMVPLFGSIPVLGALFRYDRRGRQKTNLMIFLKPTVVRTSAAGREFTSERYEYLMNQQQLMRPEERLFWSDTTVPTLPPPGTMPGAPGPAAAPPASAPKPQ
jgi:general secretion pathway protein D